MTETRPTQKKTIPKIENIERKARTTADRVKLSGKTTRVKGHMGASTRRNQGKRDSKNS